MDFFTELSVFRDREFSDQFAQRLGPTMMISASLILAIRTAKRPPEYSKYLSNRDYEAELEFAVKVAGRLLDTAIRRKPGFSKQGTSNDTAYCRGYCAMKLSCFTL